MAEGLHVGEFVRVVYGHAPEAGSRKGVGFRIQDLYGLPHKLEFTRSRPLDVCATRIQGSCRTAGTTALQT